MTHIYVNNICTTCGQPDPAAICATLRCGIEVDKVCQCKCGAYGHRVVVSYHVCEIHMPTECLGGKDVGDKGAMPTQTC